MQVHKSQTTKFLHSVSGFKERKKDKNTHVHAWFLAHLSLVVADLRALYTGLKRSNDQDVGVLDLDLIGQVEAVAIGQGDHPKVISRQQTHRLCLQNSYSVSMTEIKPFIGNKARS